MDLWRQIDLYCERTDPGFWSEPANAITNAAFLLAAVLVWRLAAGAQPPHARDARVLATLIGLIGAGSFLFHTLATVWAAWLDQGAIALYIYVFLWLFLVRIAGLPWWGALGGSRRICGGEQGADRASSRRGASTARTLTSRPSLALALLAAYAWRRRQRGSRETRGGHRRVRRRDRPPQRRSDDLRGWPLGTHFVWHCLIAFVAYLTATALPASAQRPA